MAKNKFLFSDSFLNKVFHGITNLARIIRSHNLLGKLSELKKRKAAILKTLKPKDA